jgi:hypothetical protein
MKRSDKFLIGIVAGIALLVVVAFVVALLRPPPAYRAEDTPEGIAHNYLLALQQGDYDRAYGYLSPGIPGYPSSVEAFIYDISDNSWQFRELETGSVSITVETARVADNRATVSVRETQFYRGGIFESSQRTQRFNMQLRQEEGIWRIYDAESYWLRCWLREQGCPDDR